MLREGASQSLGAIARDIGERAAGPAADEVDREGRFPHEAIAEIRRSGLLGALIPRDHGGPEATVTEMASAVAVIAQYCASTALVLAMHGIQVACLVRHGQAAAISELAPGLLRGEMLLANGNSETGLGGERRTSRCALEPIAEGFSLSKDASTVSYGEYADGVLATARRSPDSSGGDQVLAICLPPTLSLEPMGQWDTLGLRGTCSRPARLTAVVPPHMVIGDYEEVFLRTSLPVSTILLGSVWHGIAEEAARRAHTAVRSESRKARLADPHAPAPASALRLAELGVILHEMRAVMADGARTYESVKDTPEALELPFSTSMNNLKLSTSTLVVDIVDRAMRICGLVGYMNRTPVTVARLSRDASAAPLMVNNDRTLLAHAQSLLLRKGM